MIIKGTELSKQIILDTRYQVEKLDKKPKVKILMFGDDPASETYVGKKIEACEKANINYSLSKEKDATPEEAFQKIREANMDPDITAIMLQLPLPENLDQETLLAEIDPKKDVDCLTPENFGRLCKGLPRYLPCTPQGIFELFKSNSIKVRGKFICIVNSSNIVGKPLFHMALNKGAVPFVCNINTPEDIKLEMIKRSDILVTAVGIPDFITKEMVSPKSIIIDVGITRKGNKIVGDVDFKNVEKQALAVTPVPGGVGPMTVAMLIKNVCQSATMT